MAKKSAIMKDKRRRAAVTRDTDKRAALKAIINDRDASPEERFAATLKLSDLPRDGSKTRMRNRCELTGRPRGTYRRFRISRIALRDLAQTGQIPGVTKSSW